MTTKSSSSKFSRNLMLIIFAGSIVGGVSFGIRASLGVFLQPISAEFSWGREVFGLAIGIQMLLWGAFQPIAGAIADRYGTAKVIVCGAILYAAGIALMSLASTPLGAHLTLGIMLGLGMSGSGMWLAFPAVGRAAPVQHRTLALGIVSAMSSFGQFAFVPIGQGLLNEFGWQIALLLLAITSLSMIPMAFPLRGRPNTTEYKQQSLSEAIGEALVHRGYLLLNAGFFVCGFHVMFVSTHLPAYLVDRGLSANVGAWTLALIGLGNIVGSFTAGLVGDFFSKKLILCALYLGRSIIIMAFILLPLSTTNSLIFGVFLGLLWLSTVPITTALVAQIFGPQYLITLSGIVFFTHQIGAFLGSWLGGAIFDLLGSYDTVWWIAILLGIIAAMLHYPIDERPIDRTLPVKNIF